MIFRRHQCRVASNSRQSLSSFLPTPSFYYLTSPFSCSSELFVHIDSLLLCFQILPHSFSQWSTSKRFAINCLRTLSHSVEGVPRSVTKSAALGTATLYRVQQVTRRGQAGMRKRDVEYCKEGGERRKQGECGGRNVSAGCRLAGSARQNEGRRPPAQKGRPTCLHVM